MEIQRDYDLERKSLLKLTQLFQDDPRMQKFNSGLFDEKFLLHFIRWSGYKPKKAYSTLANYILIRKDKHPEIFGPLKPSTTTVDHGIMDLLKGRDRSNSYVFVCHFGNWHPSLLGVHDFVRATVLIAEEVLDLPDLDVHGLVVICNFANFGKEQMCAASIKEARRVIDIFWHAFPLKPKAVHIVNEVALVKAFAKILQPFAPKKSMKLVTFHGDNCASLHPFISPDVLPASLGGNLSEEAASAGGEMRRRILQKEEFYERFSRLISK